MAAVDYAAVVQQLYISYFGRPADPYGAANFAAQLSAMGAPTNFKDLNTAVQADKAGTTALSKLVNSFNTAGESVALYGTDNSQLGISKFVEAVYKNILGRSPDFDGGNFWISAIVNGTLTKANAAAAISEAALENTSAQGLLDAKAVANKLVVAADFTDTLKTDISKTNAYSGNDAAASGRGLLSGVTATTDTDAYHATVLSTVDVLVQATVPHTDFSLTAGVDTPTSTIGNDVFTAGLATDVSTGKVNVATLSAFDVIDGGAGTDTLNAYFSGGVTLPAATVKNVEIVNIYSDAATSADFSAWTGITNLNIHSDATSAVAVTSTAAAVSVDAGSTVSVTDNGSTTKTVSISNNTGKASVISKGVTTVNLADTDSALEVTNNGTGTALTVNVDGVGTGAAATITDIKDVFKSITVNAASDSSVVLAGTAGTTATSVTLTGSGALTADVSGLANVATVTIGGSGGVTVDTTGGAVTKIDASTSTGNNSVTVDGTKATFTGGAGNDTVHLAAAPTKAINGGAGANVLDLVDITDLTTLTKTALLNATNFQTLSLSGAVDGAGGALDVSGLGATFTGVTVNTSTDVSDLTFSKVASGFNFTELDSQAAGSIITLKTDGKADVLNLTLGNADTAVALDETAVGITASNFEIVNVAAHADVSGGAIAHSVALIVAQATTLNITGEAGVDFTGSTLTKVATVAASAATGDITVALTVTDGSTVTTGSGSDTIVTAAAADKIDTINTGTGSDSVTVVDGNNVITFGGGAKATSTLHAGDGDNTVIVNGAGKSDLHFGAGDNTITGSAGASTIEVTNGDNTITGGAGANTITAGDGDNTITAGAGGNTITVGNGTNTVTSGAGDDLITVGSGTNTVSVGLGVDTVAFSASATSSAVFTTIKDLAAGDILDFSGLTVAVHNADGKLGAALTSGVTDYQTFLNQAVHSGVAGTVSWFVFGNDTYIVEEVGTTGSFQAGTDHVVKLTGKFDLSAAVINHADSTLTLAASAA